MSLFLVICQGLLFCYHSSLYVSVPMPISILHRKMDPLNRNSFKRIHIHRHVLSEGSAAKKQEGEASKEGSPIFSPLGLTIMASVGVAFLASFFVLRLYCLSLAVDEEEEEAKPQDQANDELASFPMFFFGCTQSPSSSPSPPPNSSSLTSFEESCAICLDDYVLGDCIMILPRCEHMFHKACIDQWLLSHSLNCPICRTCALGENNAAMGRNCQIAAVVNPSPSLNLNWAHHTRTALRVI